MTVTVALLVIALGCVLVLLGYFIQLSISLSKERGRDNVEITEHQDLLSPPQIMIKNHSKFSKTAHVFGFNSNWKKENFGNDEDVEVRNAVFSIDYSELLTSSALYPFEVNLMRLQVSSKEVLNKIFIKVIHKNPQNYRFSSAPINLEKILKEQENRFQNNILDIHTQFIIDAETTLEISKLPPESELTITLFPHKRYSLRAMLRALGKHPAIPQIPRGININKEV